MADQERIQYLFDQYLRKKCTPAEVDELIMLLQDEKAEEMLSSRMKERWEQMISEEGEQFRKGMRCGHWRGRYHDREHDHGHFAPHVEQQP